MNIDHYRGRGKRTRRAMALNAFGRKVSEKLTDLRALLFYQRFAWVSLDNHKHKRRAKKTHPVVNVMQVTKQKAKHIKIKQTKPIHSEKSNILQRLKEAHSE